MESLQFGKLKKMSKRHAAEVSKQTGFPSPATHYLEPSIDLNEVLTTTKDATFFVRITSDEWTEHMIIAGDILIIDRSLKATVDDLVLAIQEGAFIVLRIPQKPQEDSFTVWGVITYIIHAAL